MPEQAYSVQGERIDWPYVTSVIAEPAGTLLNYRVRWTSLPVVQTVNDDIVASECKSGCSIFQFHKHYDIYSRVWTVGPNTKSIDLGISSTWPELSANINSKNGGSGNFIQEHTINGSEDGECAGLIIARTNAVHNQVPWETIISMALNPQGRELQCVPTTPTVHWCALANPVLNFNHGIKVVSDYELNGSTVTEPVQVECTTAMKFSLNLVSGNSGILLSNGMTANLLVEGNKMGTALDGKSGNNTLNISSTLIGDKPVAGQFEGTSVLMVAYP